MTDCPFRFGMNLATPIGSRSGWRDKARQIEDLGYDVLTVADPLGMRAPGSHRGGTAHRRDHGRLPGELGISYFTLLEPHLAGFAKVITRLR